MRRRSTYTPPSPPPSTIALLVAGCTVFGIYIDVMLFATVAAW